MAIQKIRLLGDPILRRETDPVARIDDEVKALARDLLDTLAKADGVGLAAPQIGVPRRVAVVAAPGEEEDAAPEPRVFVNPVILEKSGPVAPAEEGCLSIPGVYEIVRRPARIRVSSQGLDGALREETFEGITARILQHEIDHLEGVLFIDRIGPLRRALLKKKLRAFLE